MAIKSGMWIDIWRNLQNLRKFRFNILAAEYICIWAAEYICIWAAEYMGG